MRRNLQARVAVKAVKQAKSRPVERPSSDRAMLVVGSAAAVGAAHLGMWLLGVPYWS
jgi:hypothetical protein